MSRKRKNIIDVPQAQKFLFDAYGLRTKAVNFYHLKVWHEEHDGWFDWYHTMGSIVINSMGENGQYYPRSLGYALEDEDLAIKINEAIWKKNTQSTSRGR